MMYKECGYVVEGYRQIMAYTGISALTGRLKPFLSIRINVTEHPSRSFLGLTTVCVLVLSIIVCVLVLSNGIESVYKLCVVCI